MGSTAPICDSGRLPMSEELAGNAAAAEVLYTGVMGGRLTVVTFYFQKGKKDEAPNRVPHRHGGLEQPRMCHVFPRLPHAPGGGGALTGLRGVVQRLPIMRAMSLAC